MMLHDCNQYLDLLIQNLTNNNNALIEKALYTQLLINLHDLLKALEERRAEITFTDNIDIDPEQGVNDIFDLIRVHRNAACHQSSGLREIKDMQTIFTFNIFTGNVKVKIGDNFFGSDYSDDICIYYGPWRIYLNRHLKRLLDNLNGL